MASHCCLAQTKSLRAQVDTTANRTLLVRESSLHISGQLHKLLHSQEGNKVGTITEQRLLCAVSKQGTQITQKRRASTLPLCLWTSQSSHAAGSLFLHTSNKRRQKKPKSCWEEFLHCTFHERLPSPFHLGLLHSCPAFACPNFHGPQGPTKNNITKPL